MSFLKRPSFTALIDFHQGKLNRNTSYLKINLGVKVFPFEIRPLLLAVLGTFCLQVAVHAAMHIRSPQYLGVGFVFTVSKLLSFLTCQNRAQVLRQISLRLQIFFFSFSHERNKKKILVQSSREEFFYNCYKRNGGCK